MFKALNLLRPRSETVDTADQPEVEMSSTSEISDVANKPAESVALSEPATAAINAEEVSNDALEEIYTWVDQISFSRPRRNLARDFSDGGMTSGRQIFSVTNSRSMLRASLFLLQY